MQNQSTRGKKNIVLGVSVFVLVLVASLLTHLPAAWVIGQQSVQSQLKASGVKLSAVDGTVWNGSVHIRYRNSELGELSWSLQPLSLLFLNLNAELNWQYQASLLSGQVQSALLSATELQLQDVKGELVATDVLNLSKGVVRLPPSMSMLEDMSGTVNIASLNSVIDLQRLWPKGLQATATVNGLNLMGNQFPQIALNASQPDSQGKIVGQLTGEGSNWNLTGKVELQSPSKYHGQLEVKAASERDLPDWAFVMQKKSPTHYLTRF